MEQKTALRRISVIASHLSRPNLPKFLQSAPISSDSSPTLEKVLYLDGNNLTPKALYQLGYDKEQMLDLTEGAWLEVKRSREMLEKKLEKKEITYGVNTGFGNFAHVVISDEQLEQLQKNLIMSHACGVGEPLPVERARMLFALRLNVLAKGYSGVSPQLVRNLIDRFNAGLVSLIPEKGTVGASGDLAPLAHLVLGFLGMGKMWNPKNKRWEDAKQVLKEFGFEPLVLRPKEGLALINGTQFIASLGCEALERCKMLCRVADLIGALSLEALRGSMHPFEPEIHQARPHKGQIETAKRLLNLLNRGISEIQHSHENCGRVQDAYTLRCMPQVHGVVKDTVEFVGEVITTEINSATDNPMVFYQSEKILSGGNFHGEYPAKMLDFLAIGISELGTMSERRTASLINNKISEFPLFLVEKGGINSGFMMAQVTAAALVSENKTLCHPSSVDSIETSASKEDHVSMGGWAARKCLQVVENVENILAIELLCACQALEFLRPLKSTEALESAHRTVRKFVKPWDQDRYLKPDIDSAKFLIQSGILWDSVKSYIFEK